MCNPNKKIEFSIVSYRLGIPPTHTHTHTKSITYPTTLYPITISASMCDYTLSGLLKAPRTYEQLKTELDRMRKANGKLFREFGYVTGCNPDQFTISELCDIVDNLKTSYKKNKTAGPKEERKQRKKLWKQTKRRVKAVANSVARIITFCVKQAGKKNLAEMQQATSSPTSCGWNKYYISGRYEKEKEMFEKQFENIETNRAPYGQIRAYHDVVITYHIRRKVINEWNNMHYAHRKDLLYVDIWNREKKFEQVRDELKLSTPIIVPAWDAHNYHVSYSLGINPLCVFEKSLREKRINEIKKDATNSYREAQKMSLKYWEDRALLKDALIVYWWQKDNFNISWRGHPFDSDIVATLKGSPPKNFRKMVQCYKVHVQYLNDAAAEDRKGYTDAGANLYQWKCWTKRLLSDLEILLEGLKKGDVHSFEESPFRGCKTLKGCTRDILAGNCREYVGYIGEEQKMREEEIERQEKWIEEMREEEIERLEELEERMRGYGSD